jgi:glutamate formiminotransferase/formiminotetrahydrofolate cyclodeaminase
MNITSIKKCPLHFAFEEACKSAQKRGMRVTGTEIVGVVPMECMIEAGKYFLKKQRRSCGVPNEELIKIAIKSMGLNDVSKFEPNKKIIELMIPQEKTPLLQMTTKKFAEVVASDAPAPGGGSISAYVGALGVALATMVANLSANKKTWDKRVEEFSEYAEKGQQLYDKLLYLVDADTKAFNKIMNAYALSPGEAKDKALNEATREAIEIPFSVMKTTTYALDLIKKMTEIGNPSSVTDAGVGALCARTAIRGAYLNVKINMAFYKEDKEWSEKIIKECEDMVAKADQYEKQILQIVDKKIAEN